MYLKLLATLPAILAATAFAEPIYFTANDLRTTPPATAGLKRDAAAYPAHLDQPIYFTANDPRANPPATAGVKHDAAPYAAYPDEPIYFTANTTRTTNAGTGTKLADAATEPGLRPHAPVN